MRRVFFHNPMQSPTSSTGWRWWFSVWFPVVLAITVIGFESTNSLSAANTSSLLRPVFEHFFGPIRDSAWDAYHHYLRKTGHFVGYGTVGFTFLRAWLHTLNRRAAASLFAWRLKSSLFAILSTAFIASCDEIHQASIPSRTGSPLDVLLDTSGACVLCLLVFLLCWARRPRSRVAQAA